MIKKTKRKRVIFYTEEFKIESGTSKKASL